ncbi:hypothetical protein PVK62_03890 [Aliivibrio sp. S3MY1]|uniref:hypothetical protein n=1 Tax=unclassified Aliivibrio TaxID=2645654 RepID=UPI0023782668|nr:MULTISPECIES: hypothetical protein [unclassified Aliivibrio]MDD9194974.1 hypothetical protein [Aliivibrio sp. S3MY1]MDD9198270.1 hypothetical protein [Aliivibrio sp. S2MY1]
MKYKLTTLVFSLLMSVMTFSTQAALTDKDIAVYNQAAAGDEDFVESAYERFEQLIQADGATPLTLVYLGSAETLKGRDAMMPWTAMKYVEQGLAKIGKGLNLLATESASIEDQPVVSGLPNSYLTRALAAATYSQLPDMFNHFERGYDLYLVLLSEPKFQQQPYQATAWVYGYAIQAALRAEDQNQATQWLAFMIEKEKSHPESIKAQALMNAKN